MTSIDVVGSTRERLGRVGVWLGVLASAGAGEERSAAQRIGDLGYGSIWCPERIGNKEAFAHVGGLLAGTTRIVVGTGIASVWARHPASMQAGAMTLGAFYPGRFVLGIGISHAASVERTGQTYGRPMEHMARYLDSMDLTAEQGSDIGPVVPRVLASLRPNMLQLARDRSDGAHTYFVPPDHTVGARQVLGPGKLLVAEQAVVLGTDPDEARRVAREHMSWYLQLPNYANNLKQLGYTDEDIAGGGSDRPVDAIVAWGDAVAVATRVREHHDAGADHVLIQALGDGNKALEQLVRLGPVVVGVGRS